MPNRRSLLQLRRRRTSAGLLCGMTLLGTLLLWSIQSPTVSAQGSVHAWGMAGAFTSSSRGIEAVNWNPANLALSPEGLQAAHQLNLDVCGTWAATHGGARWAHWWGRVRRSVGWPLAPARRGIWPTDVTLLDFEGRDEEDRSVTERLLRFGKRWSSPVVFVQHHWAISDAESQERWLRWLTWMATRLDVRFVRFCDV